MFPKKTALALTFTTALSLSINAHAEFGYEDTSFNSDIVDAVEYGSKDRVESLLRNGVNPDERGDFGTTPLIRAAYRGSTDLVRLLLQSGANPNVADIGGATPLHVASREGHEAVVDMLLQYGASVNAADNEGNTPLMRASAKGNTTIVAVLISNGGKVNDTNDVGESALLYAAEADDYDSVDMLLAQGAEIKIVNEEGSSPAEIAQRKGNEMMIASIAETAPQQPVFSTQEGVPPMMEAAPAPIQLASASAKPQINSKEIFHRLEAENKINLAQAGAIKKKPAKDWLNGLKDVFEAAGAFELAAVKNYEAGTKYVLLDFGSFPSKVFADKKAAEIKSQHGDLIADIGIAVIEKGSNFVVNGGILSDKNEAFAICKKLVAQGVNCRPVETTLITSDQFQKFNISSSASSASAPAKEMAANAAPKSIEDLIDLPQPPAVPSLPAPSAASDDLAKKEMVAAVESPAPKAAEKVAEKAVAKPVKKKVVESITPSVPVAVTQAPLEQASDEEAEAPSLQEIAGMETVESTEIANQKIAGIEEEKNELEDFIAKIFEEDNGEANPALIKKHEKEAPTPDNAEEKVSAKPVNIASGLVASKAPEVAPEEMEKIEEAEPIEYPAPAPIVSAPKKAEKAEKVEEAVAVAPPKAVAIKEAAIAPAAKPASNMPVEAKERESNIPILPSSLTASEKASDLPKLAEPEPVKKVVVKSAVIAEPKPRPVPVPVVVASGAPSAPTPKVNEEPKVLNNPDSKPDEDLLASMVKPRADDDKFEVAKPVRVDAATPQDSRPVIRFGKRYVAPTPLLSRNRWVQVDYFQTAGVTYGFWNHVKSTYQIPDDLSAKAVMGLRGNGYYSAQIGPFVNDGQAQQFCNTISPENLKCGIQRSVANYNRYPSASRSSGYKNFDGSSAGRHSSNGGRGNVLSRSRY